MQSIINTIISKPDWTKKILNEEIVQKWTNELLDQNIDINKIKIIMKMLNKTNQNLDEYNWFCKFEFKVDELFNNNKCTCKCKICIGNECTYDETIDDTIYMNLSEINECKTICECYKKCSSSRLSFLHKFINLHSSIISNKNRLLLIKYIEDFKSTGQILYHPNSNSLQLDVIHPSLDCYISGVSKIINTNKEVDEDMLFQWLPLNVKLINNYYQFQKKYQTGVEEVLYQQVNNIFNKFIPMFDKTLLNLNFNNVINDIIILQNCQVIVKIQELHLTPENPEFNGGSWHLEGTKYEKIIATGIYYYDFENIKDNYLQFRTTLEEDAEYNLSYPQDCPIYVDFHYALGEDQHKNKSNFVNLGKINTKQGLSIVFPNIMQHKVSNVELLDKTKPGYRKILVFFLIDPRESILSVDDIDQSNLSTEDKLDYETLLMYQRKNESTLQNKVFEREISLCEH